MPPSQAGAGWGEYEAARGSWLPSPHLTTSRALECFLRKSHQQPKGRALKAPWRPGGQSWNSSCQLTPAPASIGTNTRIPEPGELGTPLHRQGK